MTPTLLTAVLAAFLSADPATTADDPPPRKPNPLAPSLPQLTSEEEDALDKVIGSLARAGADPSTGFLVVTSRASYELVQKTAIAGVSFLAAVSRPTSLAIQLADQAGITLVGLLRGRSANVYSHQERLVVG